MEPEVSVAPYARSSFQASLIPALDSLRSLGIVWIPGLMTGMVLAGTPPLRAAVYQFVTIAMIFASSGLTLPRRDGAHPRSRLLARGAARARGRAGRGAPALTRSGARATDRGAPRSRTGKRFDGARAAGRPPRCPDAAPGTGARA